MHRRIDSTIAWLFRGRFSQHGKRNPRNTLLCSAQSRYANIKKPSKSIHGSWIKSCTRNVPCSRTLLLDPLPEANMLAVQQRADVAQVLLRLPRRKEDNMNLLMIAAVTAMGLGLTLVGCSDSGQDADGVGAQDASPDTELDSTSDANADRSEPDDAGTQDSSADAADATTQPDAAPNGNLGVVIDADRLSGMVPLSVFFDASTTTGLDGDDFVNATFRWDFDKTGVDPDHPYPTGMGFVSAHVFDEPGTYTVEVEVSDRLGENTTRKTITIEAQDFSGETFYMAADGDDENPGTMAEPKQTLEHAITLLGPSTRVLLRRGDTFTTSAISFGGVVGPTLLGAYTDPDQPSTDFPTIHSDAKDGPWAILRMSDVVDLRVVGLRFESGGSSATEPRWNGGVMTGDESEFILLQDLMMERLGSKCFSVHGSSVTVSRVTARDTGPYFVYASKLDKYAFIGNTTREHGGNYSEHVMRFQGGQGAYVAHNDYQSGIAKSCVQVRGNSERVVLYDNTLDKSTGFNPQNDTSEERIRYGLADSNRVLDTRNLYEHGSFSSAGNLRAVAKDIAFRNNRIEGNIYLGSHPLVGNADRIYIYNNTLARQSQSEKIRVQVSDDRDPAEPHIYIFDNILYYEGPIVQSWTVLMKLLMNPTNLTCRSNLLYAHDLEPNGRLLDIGETRYTLSDLPDITECENLIYADPLFTSLDPNEATWQHLNSESPAIDAASAVFSPGYGAEGTSRPKGEANDIGAIEGF